MKAGGGVHAVELPKRLKTIAAWVPRGAVAADIGTDHALLPVHLVREGGCPRVIATEASPGPWRRAAAALAASPWRERIDLRLGDGLSTLAPGEAQVLILAGMGGATMCGILAAAGDVLEAGPLLLLQPMNGAWALRRWLYGHDWHLAREKLVAEKRRLFLIMAAVPGREVPDEPLDLAIGPRLIEGRDPLLPAYLADMAARLERLAASLAAAPHPGVEKAAAVEKLLNRIEEVRSRCLSPEKI